MDAYRICPKKDPKEMTISCTKPDLFLLVRIWTMNLYAFGGNLKASVQKRQEQKSHENPSTLNGAKTNT